MSSLDRVSNRFALVVVLFVTVAAAFFRFQDLGTPGLWLDEILGVMHARDFSLLARGVGPTPLDGPIYHALLSLVLAFTSDEGALRAPFALAGVLTIPVVALVARAVAGNAAGMLAAVLVATSPIHIYYSRELRSYVLILLALSVGLLGVVHRASAPEATEEWPVRQRATVWIALLALVLTAAHAGVYGVVLLAGAALRIPTVRSGRPRAGLELLGATAVCAAIYVWLYRSSLGSGADIAEAPPLTLTLVAQLLQALVSGHHEALPAGRFLLVDLVLIAIGAVVVTLRAGVRGLVIVIAAAGGLALPILALTFANHWINVRYLLLALPGVLILIAVGTAATVAAAMKRVAPLRLQGALTGGAIAVVCVVIAWLQQAPTATALASKADWRYVAQTLGARSRPGDLIVASNAWTQVCLSYYLPRVGLSAELRSADESVDTARPWLASQRPVFLVTGGFHRSQAIRQWMEEYLLVYSSAAESIRVHFHPDRVTYLTTRAPLDEHAANERALWGRASGQLLFADERPALLIDGWGNLEKGPDGRLYRWAEGDRSRAYVPTVHYKPDRLELHLEPVRTLPSQSVTIKVDEVVVSVVDIPRGESFQHVDLKRVNWTTGPHLLSLEFAASAQPGGSDDRRKLSALLRSARLR